MLIAGKPHDGRLTTIFAPWDGRALREVAFAGPAELELAVQAAVRGFEKTRRMSAHARAEVLDRMAAALRARADEAAALIRDEAGKPWQYARGEVLRCVDTLRFAADEARRGGGEVVQLDAAAAGLGRIGVVQRVPAGPVLGISPFNFPLNLVAHKVAPAIAAGCSFLLKPSEQTPSAAILLGELAVEAGYPAEAVNVVPCDREVADALVGDDRFAVLSFTGSARVGWAMKARSGRKRVALELGGNAAAVICEDADLATAVPRLTIGAFAYAGQVCISVQRILVHRSKIQDFTNDLVNATERLPWGDPARPEVVSGPMIDARNADRVQAWVQAAGGTTLCGGERQGNTLRPMVIEGMDRQSTLYREEVFGPVVCVEPFTTVDEAIAKVNEGRWGLQAGVFTQHVPTLNRFWDELEVGAVIHDDAPVFRVDQMPYGGVKDSGLGREGLRYAIAEYSEPRLLAMRKG